MNCESIKTELKKLSGCNNEYYKKVIPGSKPTWGVKVPELRKIAKKIVVCDKVIENPTNDFKNYKDFLNNNPLDIYEMEMLQAFVIGYARDDIDVLLDYFRLFIPQIHDWAVNDALCQTFTIARKYRKKTFDMLMEYKNSNKEFEVRVVAVTLMSHFLVDDYIDNVIKVLDELCVQDYYSKMGVAWAVATIMAKYPDKCMNYLKNNNLDDWTYNKAIQKMIESFRVSDDDKDILRTMKR